MPTSNRARPAGLRRPRPAAARAKPLTREQEAALAARIQSGDIAARNELVERNAGLVHERARAFPQRHYDDLVQVGNLGLIEAAERFNPRVHRTKFSTYAVNWINMEQIRYLHGVQVVLVPLWHRNKKLVQSTSDKFEARGGPKAHRNRQMLAAGRAAMREHLLFATSNSTDDDAGEEAMRVPPPADPRQHPDELDQQESIAALARAVSALPEAAGYVIVHHFGIDGHRPRTMAAIARDLGCTRGWVRVLRDRALGQLRELVDPSLCAG